MMAMTDQVDAEEPQRDQRADRRRRQAGQDGERVDEALVEDAEHDVDRDDRAASSRALVGERVLEDLGGAGEGGRDRRRHRSAPSSADRCASTAVAERHALRQVEGDRHRRQLAELVDGQRAGGALDAGEGAERHQLAVAIADADIR